MLKRRALRVYASDDPAWESAPTGLDPRLAGYWQAFNVLHASRPAGFGASAIPLSEVASYMELHGIEDPKDREEFLAVIHHLDAVWLEWARSQAAKESKPSA